MLIRPRQSVLVWLLSGIALIIALIVVGALRTRQPLIAWIGAALAIGCVPLVDWYRRSVIVDERGVTWRRFGAATTIPFDEIVGYGTWKVWAYRSGTWDWLSIFGKHAARIDLPTAVCRRSDVERLIEVVRGRAPMAELIVPSPPRRDLRFLAVWTVTTIVVILAIFVVSLLIPMTLGADRLFAEAAVIGVIAGCALGARLGHVLVPRAPIAVVAAAALLLMVVTPAGVLLYNALRPQRFHRAETTVVARRSYVDKDSVTYVIDVQIDGRPKQLRPGRSQWEQLQAGNKFPACVADGALGYPVIVSLTRDCK